MSVFPLQIPRQYFSQTVELKMFRNGKWLAKALRAQSTSLRNLPARHSVRCYSDSTGSSSSTGYNPGSADPPPMCEQEKAKLKEAKAAATAAAAAGGSPKRKPTSISADRLTQLFESEMLHLEKTYRQPDPVQAMQQMTRMSELDPFERARWLADEVPCHFAHRNKLKKNLDEFFGWTARCETKFWWMSRFCRNFGRKWRRNAGKTVSKFEF